MRSGRRLLAHLCMFSWLRHYISQCPSTWANMWFTGTDGANYSITLKDTGCFTSGKLDTGRAASEHVHKDNRYRAILLMASTNLSLCSTLSSPPPGVWLQTCPALGVGGGALPSQKKTQSWTEYGSCCGRDITSCPPSSTCGDHTHLSLQQRRKARGVKEKCSQTL